MVQLAGKWQDKQDLHPHQPVLETGMLLLHHCPTDRRDTGYRRLTNGHGSLGHVSAVQGQSLKLDTIDVRIPRTSSHLVHS